MDSSAPSPTTTSYANFDIWTSHIKMALAQGCTHAFYAEVGQLAEYAGTALLQVRVQVETCGFSFEAFWAILRNPVASVHTH
jgi:hypothetical protein